jgi:superfamily I DNA/RNA helicase
MNPTPEQQAIAESFATGVDMVIEAGAGTGKTSTLRMLADTEPGTLCTYIAYNRAIADEARASFPGNVNCATAHSLAYRAMGHLYRERLNGPRVPARAVARLLRIDGPERIGDVVLSHTALARLVMEAVRNFCYSDAQEVLEDHVPVKPGLDEPEQIAFLQSFITPLARAAWEDKAAITGRLQFVHDDYLKLWALSNPVLPVDCVLLDEAQDANPVIAGVVVAQPAQRIMVGDSSQQIYSWRGAMNALARFKGVRLTLSQSFRFGQAIADEANLWLDLLEAPLRLTGSPAVASRLDDVAAPSAVLCRTNAEAFQQVMEFEKVGKRAALVGGGAEIKRLAEAAITLKQGAGSSHPELLAFTTWAELVEYVERDEGGSDLAVFVRLIDAYGPQRIIALVDRLGDEDQADVVISTAHKAKGREWATVKVADDFPTTVTDDEGLRLAYVTVTRAREVLDTGGLSWTSELNEAKAVV